MGNEAISINHSTSLSLQFFIPHETIKEDYDETLCIKSERCIDYCYTALVIA